MSIEIKLEIASDSHNTDPNPNDLKFVIEDEHVAIVVNSGYEREYRFKKKDFATLLEFCKEKVT